MLIEETVINEEKFCKELEFVTNEHGVYIYKSQNLVSSINLPYILRHYKDWLIENNIVNDPSDLGEISEWPDKSIISSFFHRLEKKANSAPFKKELEQYNYNISKVNGNQTIRDEQYDIVFAGLKNKYSVSELEKLLQS